MWRSDEDMVSDEEKVRCSRNVGLETWRKCLGLVEVVKSTLHIGIQASSQLPIVGWLHSRDSFLPDRIILYPALM